MTTPPNPPGPPSGLPGTAGAPLAGRYLLIDQIGSGGMGSVWRAWDLRHQKFVAAKVLGQHDSGMLLRFVREQSVRIQHPHVVAPVGWAAEDNHVIFAMDLVRGGSVHTLLGDHGPLPESYVAVLMDQTLQALAAVHGAGVVHRDIKPANLMLEPTGSRRPHVRLGDFGVAALIDEVRLTRFPGAIGTEGYMSPEQAEGAPPDPCQDLYAAGIVGIQMLTGLSPRNQKGVPPGLLTELLSGLTQPDPAYRFPSANEALHVLHRIGVPQGAPWQHQPEPPEVFDQLGEVEVPLVTGYAAPSQTPSAPDRPVQDPEPSPPNPSAPYPSQPPSAPIGGTPIQNTPIENTPAADGLAEVTPIRPKSARPASPDSSDDLSSPSGRRLVAVPSTPPADQPGPPDQPAAPPVAGPTWGSPAVPSAEPRPVSQPRTPAPPARPNPLSQAAYGQYGPAPNGPAPNGPAPSNVPSQPAKDEVPPLNRPVRTQPASGQSWTQRQGLTTVTLLCYGLSIVLAIAGLVLLLA